MQRSATSILALATLLAGCRTTYNVTLAMEPQNEAAIELLGLRTSMHVVNRGPGPIELWFVHEGLRSKTTRLEAGGESQTSLPCPLVVGVTTDSASAEVHVTAAEVTGLRIRSASRPRD